MKKVLSAIVTFAILLVFSSAYSTKTTDSRVGYIAPIFSISNSDTTLSLQQMKGKYVLLTFWTSTDAESRIFNRHYNRLASKYGKVQHLAVNYDRSAKVFNEVATIDSLLAGSQFHDSDGKASAIYESYRIGKKGYRTLLIDPNGEIISENPSESEIAKL